MTWNIQLDRSWEREGLDTKGLASEEIEIGLSERFAVETLLIAVLTYVGGKVLDKLTDKAITKGVDATIEKLATFARSREKKLRLELNDSGFDPRVKLLAAQIQSMDASEFKTAIAALPTLRVRVRSLLDAVPEEMTDVWYVWDADAKDWAFTYYTTAGGDVIEEEPPDEEHDTTGRRVKGS